MKEIEITTLQAGQRLDRLLMRYLKEAHSGFLYKMLRKKNITLNGHKASGNEKLQEGDVIRLFFADETLMKLTGLSAASPSEAQSAHDAPSAFAMPSVQDVSSAYTAPSAHDTPSSYAMPSVHGQNRSHLVDKSHRPVRLDVIYEDRDILLVDKPAGMLTQKAQPSDMSLNEYAMDYLLAEGAVTKEDLLTFRPSVCNRLDRNTSGIVAVGKTIAGLQILSAMFRDRSVEKFYKALVIGAVKEEKQIDGWLKKDEKTNTVKILHAEEKDAQRIRTRYIPVRVIKVPELKEPLTLLDVELLTGRSHQIRAHLASEGHAIVGDPKYGSRRVNDMARRKYGVKRQLLHAGRLTFPDYDMDVRRSLRGSSGGPESPGSGNMRGEILKRLSGRTFTAPLPEDFEKVIRSGGTRNSADSKQARAAAGRKLTGHSGSRPEADRP